jgi:hypothetical protein
MSTRHLDDLRAQAQHARQRYQLYKAKVYGPRATSLARLRELERAYEQAETRLRAAEAQERVRSHHRRKRARSELTPRSPPAAERRGLSSMRSPAGHTRYENVYTGHWGPAWLSRERSPPPRAP